METAKFEELVAGAAGTAGVTKKETTRVINAFIDEVKKNLILGKKVNLYKFCNFTPKVAGGRTYNNPAHPEQKVQVQDHRVVKAKVSQSLKKQMNTAPF